MADAPLLGSESAPALERRRPRPPPAKLLYVNVLLLATCGLIYELLAATLGSYLIGDSVTQFSLVIALYLSAMGVGAWLSRHLEGQLVRRFIELELLVALVGGFASPALSSRSRTSAIFRSYCSRSCF